jgi:hypothetical protein
VYPSGFPTRIVYALVLSPMHSTCPFFFILLYLIILIIFGEEYELRSSSLGRFYQTFNISSLLGPNASLNTLFSYTLNM